MGVGDLLEHVEGGEEPPRALRLHGLGEDGAEDHVRRVVGQLHVDGRGRRRRIGRSGDEVQARHAGVHRIPHHREHRLDAGALERRVHQPAVAFPGFSVRNEDAVAGEGPQHVVHQGALGEVRGAADQHLADQLWGAHGEQPPLL